MSRRVCLVRVGWVPMRRLFGRFRIVASAGDGKRFIYVKWILEEQARETEGLRYFARYASKHKEEGAEMDCIVESHPCWGPGRPVDLCGINYGVVMSFHHFLT